MRPLCVDLFCGTLAFSEGWRELGGRVIGFDLEHLPHHGPVPPGAELVLQDVRTLSGAQFKDASLIVASPPCPEYSWMAMPWRRAKQAAAALRGDGEFPSGYRGSRTIAELTALFDACFRIQREASEAAGHHIPLIVENVKGAQPWIGRARWHYGSFYLFGDVPALMPITLRIKRPGRNFHAFENGLGKCAGNDTFKVTGQPCGKLTDPRYPSKNSGGSWFAIGSPGQKELGQNPVTGGGVKQHGSGTAWFDKALDERRKEATTAMSGTKVSGDWFGTYAEMKAAGTISPTRVTGKGTSARRAASAQIARIPIELSRHIARRYWPGDLP